MKEYIVVFHMEGCGFKGEFYKDQIQKEFVYMHNDFGDQVNPLLETWNKEYDEYDVPNQILEYEAFIAEKELPIATKLKSFWLKGDVDPENAQFVAHIKGLPDSKIYITLREK